MSQGSLATPPTTASASAIDTETQKQTIRLTNNSRFDIDSSKLACADAFSS